MKRLHLTDCCFNCSLNCMKEIFSQEDLKLMNDNKTEINFSASETILRQGSFVSQILYLQKGMVKIVLEGRGERNTILKIIENEGYIALPVLGNIKQYPYSVIAISPSRVCMINKECLVSVMNRNNQASMFFIDWFSDDYQYVYQKILAISTRNNHGKVAMALLYLTDGQFSNNILKLISRKELAELSSTSTDSSNKILQQLNHDGIIEIQKQEIIIKRRDLLEKLSTVG